MYPKDVHFLVEMSLVDILKLRKAMDLVEVQYNQMIPEEEEAKDFLVGDFMDWLNFCIKEAGDA
jgi:hypothetical protein